MLPSLSNRTKSFAVAAAVLAVALCNVVFGSDWASAPPRVAGTAVHSDVPKVISEPAKPVSPAPQAKPAIANAAPPPAAAAPAPVAAPMQQPVVPQPAAPVAAAAPPSCDVAACAAAYHSFRESDCTWQPFEGPRRACTKGTEADNAAADEDLPSNRRCHFRSCAEAYSSFNPSDCTYQPLDGPRRLCTK